MPDQGNCLLKLECYPCENINQTHLILGCLILPLWRRKAEGWVYWRVRCVQGRPTGGNESDLFKVWRNDPLRLKRSHHNCWMNAPILYYTATFYKYQHLYYIVAQLYILNVVSVYLSIYVSHLSLCIWFAICATICSCWPCLFSLFLLGTPAIHNWIK